MTRIRAERKAAGLGAGGKLLALGRLIRMIAWNPLHALNTRAEEISGEMANIDFYLRCSAFQGRRAKERTGQQA